MKIICWDEIDKWEEHGDENVATDNGRPMFVVIRDFGCVGVLLSQDNGVDHPCMPSNVIEDNDTPKYLVMAGSWWFEVKDGKASCIAWENQICAPTTFRAWFVANRQYITREIFTDIAEKCELTLDYDKYVDDALKPRTNTFAEFGAMLVGGLGCKKLFDNMVAVGSRSQITYKMENES